MISAIIDFIGRSYEPVTYIVGEDTVVAAGAAGVDWPWVVSAFALVLVLYCLFRAVGGVIRA